MTPNRTNSNGGAAKNRVRGRRAGLLALALVAPCLAVGCASGGLRLDPAPGEFAEFSLARARRAQQRDSTSAAPYRSDVPWPAGAVEAERKRWTVATVGVEYDDHPVLLSNTIGTLDELSSNDSAAGVWLVDIGGELFEHGDWSGGAAISYFGTAWSSWDRTTHYPDLTSFVDWDFGEPWSLRLRYDVGYADVSGDGFATTHHVGPRLYRDWGDFGVTEIAAQYYSYDFHRIGATYPRTQVGVVGGPCALPGGPIPTPCGPPDSNSNRERRDRSGFGIIGGVEHRIRLVASDTVLRGGYTYQHYIPKGAEFHGQSHAFWVESAIQLPAQLTLDTNLTYIYRFTRNTTSFPDPDDLAPNTVYPYAGHLRHDHIVSVYSALGRAITKHVSAAAEYAYTNQHSDLESFEYDRHRIGASVTVHFE